MRGLEVTASKQGGKVSIATGVDLDVQAGEAVAIVGESGSGKSLSARAIMGLLPEGVTARGDVRLGEHASLLDFAPRQLRGIRGTEVALVMQDPFTMLNPLVPCGKQVVEALTRRGKGGLRGARAREEAERRLAQVGIDDPSVSSRFPFELSGGMRQRVAIAAAIAEDPRLLIADEPTTALDVTTQREILLLLTKLRREHDMSLILITHDLRVGFEVCDRVYVLYAGSLVETGLAREIEEKPKHPYTLGLLHAEPPVDRRLERLPDIPGWVPPPGSREGGCLFSPRCRWASDVCVADTPPLREVAPGRLSRCIRVDEIEGEMVRLELALAQEAEDPAGTGTELLVEAKMVRKVFGSGSRGTQVALDDADLYVRAGESVGLVGESGSGKTTLGRIIVGLEQADGGEMRVAGIEVVGRNLTTEEAELRRHTVQMAFQDPFSSLNPAKTIGKTLREAVRLAAGCDRDDLTQIASLLEQVGLPASYAERRPAGLSGGERQRVAIARALARKPRLLVCDEVVSALDVSVQAQILNLLEDIRRESGTSYLFITHDLAVVRQVTDRIYVLRRGSVVEQGRTADVLDNPQHPYTQELIAAIPGDHD